MKILVMGGNGQLGMSLRKVAPEYPACRFTFADLPECDITDIGSLAAVMDSAGADVIVNCAAYTAVDKAESELDAAYGVNALGASNVASLAGERDIPVVHISTDYVFDGNSSVPYRENDPVKPATVYGRTKLQGEKAVMESGADAAIIRTSWLYSEFGNNFVKTILGRATGGETIKVVDGQRGSPTYATDLARAIMAVICNGISGSGIYHYAGAGEVSWYGFARKIVSLAGKSADIIPVCADEYPSAASRPAYSVLDTSKIGTLGAVVRPWEDSLAECLRALGY